MSEKFSILYVDDEESNLRIFKNTFRREYNVYTAISAKEGIKILTKEHIDVILSDQRMPEMTGVEFLKYSLEAHPQLNRILVTGFTDFNALQSAVNDAKIFQYIQKPWQETDLRTIIEEALKVYELEQENKKLTKDLNETNEELVLINEELKLTNEKLTIAKNKAEESDRLKSAFFSNISHEIRTPMNGIIGFARILNMPDVSDDKKRKYRDIIIDSSEQLLHIISDIVEVSQLAASKVKLNVAEVNISSLLSGLITLYEDKTYENVSLSLTNEMSPKENMVISDELKLNKILSNLIDNGIKYTQEGFVHVSCKRIDDKIIFQVEDSGIGINPDVQEIIFEQFRQEDENLAREYGGLGIGLCIVKENVELMNGFIQLESKKGEGSTFIFGVPYKPAPDTNDIPEKNKNLLQQEYTVLIVEDELVNYFYIETVLADMNLNIKIVGATNGQEAVEICKENKTIHLVLMDIKMPVLNGIEATKQIKAFRKNLPIIAQTAYTSIEDIEKAKLAGCDDFINKPMDLTVLGNIIHKYLIDG